MRLRQTGRSTVTAASLICLCEAERAAIAFTKEPTTSRSIAPPVRHARAITSRLAEVGLPVAIVRALLAAIRRLRTAPQCPSAASALTQRVDLNQLLAVRHNVTYP